MSASNSSSLSTSIELIVSGFVAFMLPLLYGTVNASGDTIRTGRCPFCSLSQRRIKHDQPDFASSDKLAACRLVTEPLTFFLHASRFRIALLEQLIQAIAEARLL